MGKSEKTEYKRKQAAMLISQGKSRREVATELDVSLPTLSKYERSEAYKQELKSLHLAARQTVSATLTANVTRALNTLVEALNSENEDTRVKAASTILSKYIDLEKARIKLELDRERYLPEQQNTDNHRFMVLNGKFIDLTSSSVLDPKAMTVTHITDFEPESKTKP